jgi:hypothetical protein
MTTPADRLASWIDGVAVSWKIRVKGWLADALSFGFETFMDAIGKSYSKKLGPLLDTLEKTEGLPEEIKPLLAEIRNPTGEVAGWLAHSVAGGAVGNALGRIFDVVFLPFSYVMNRASPHVIMVPEQLIEVAKRGQLTHEMLVYWMKGLGYDESWIKLWEMLYEVRLPSEVVGPAALRDPSKYAKYWDDVAQGGITPDRLEMLKELTYKIASMQDIIQFVIREVYTPEIADKFGQFEDYPILAEPDALKAGIRPELLKQYWAAHWELPSVSQGYEMLHRGIIDQATLNLLIRARDVMPYWRDLLTKISYNPYTRVDARRMWDLGVLDDAQLLKSYTDLGYDDEHAKNMTTWTKLYVLTPQLIAQYKNGWISQSDVIGQLKGLGLSDERAEWVYKTKFQNESAARTTAQKDLTLAQIIKGVKKGKITRAQGADLLVDMGYDLQEATFILDVEIPDDETDVAVKTRELTKADILSGLRQETITQDQAREKLVAIRYTPSDAQYIVQVYMASITPPASPTVKSLTKADIVSAVKQGLITPEQGYELLVSIGYSDADANFILALVPTTSPFSPVNYNEFKAVTQKWRAAQGLEVEENIPEVRDMKVALAKAVVEGRTPDMEQTRIQIDTIRRQRRKGLISRDDEVKQLTTLGVPADYVKAVVENDDARLTQTKA